MEPTDWILWVLMLGAGVVVKPIDLALRLAGRLRGRAPRLGHVLISSRGEIKCADCGEPWDKDHACDVLVVN